MIKLKRLVDFIVGRAALYTDEEISKLRTEVNDLRQEVFSIKEFDENVLNDLIEPMKEGKKKYNNFIKAQLWMDTKVEGLEQFMADALADNPEMLEHFQNRIKRLDAMKPNMIAGPTGGGQLLAGQVKEQTEAQRIAEDEIKTRIDRLELALAAGVGGDKLIPGTVGGLQDRLIGEKADG